MSSISAFLPVQYDFYTHVPYFCSNCSNIAWRVSPTSVAESVLHSDPLLTEQKSLYSLRFAALRRQRGVCHRLLIKKDLQKHWLGSRISPNTHSSLTEGIFGRQIQSVGPQKPVSLHILQLHEGRTHNALWDNGYRPKYFQTWRKLISYSSEDNIAKSYLTTLNIKATLALTPTAHSSFPVHLFTPLRNPILSC